MQWEKGRATLICMGLHPTQQAILELAEKENIGELSLRQIGQRVGIPNSPQMVKYHLSQLEKRGLIKIDKPKYLIERYTPGWAKGLLDSKQARLYNIPIYGTANCGTGGIIAEQNLEGFLRVSNTLLGRKPAKSFFAIRASGNSMNRANVNEKQIDDGDYLVIAKDSGIPHSGDIVVAVIDNQGLVKKLVKDPEHNQILLVSESTEEYPPICIHKNDQFLINGKVVEVIKQPKN